MTEQEDVKKDEVKLNLHQKLLEIRKAVPYLKKNAKGFNFEYVKGSILLGLLRPKMDELGVLLSYDVEELNTENVERLVYDKKLGKDKKILTGRVRMKYIFTFTDVNNPSDTISKTIWTQGIGDDIQSSGGYHTYSLRYFLLGFFNIPTDKDDPDTHENCLKAAIPAEIEKVETISKEQEAKLDSLIGNNEVVRNNILGRFNPLSSIPLSIYENVNKYVIGEVNHEVEK